VSHAWRHKRVGTQSAARAAQVTVFVGFFAFVNNFLVLGVDKRANACYIYNMMNEDYSGFEWYENCPDDVTPHPPTKYERVEKTCRMCDRVMDMSSDHGVCDSCASAMEQGGEW